MSTFTGDADVAFFRRVQMFPVNWTNGGPPSGAAL